MKTIWKIFELVEVSTLDEWDNDTKCHHIMQEWDKEFNSELEAIEFLKEAKDDMVPRERIVEIKKLIIIE